MATFIPGQPGHSTYSIGVTQRLINGASPEQSTGIHTVAESQTIEYLAPVMFNEARELVPAVAGTPAIGIAFGEVTTAAGEAATLEVLRGGCLNPDAINWPASYDTALKRANAFEGAPSPTQIKIQPNA